MFTKMMVALNVYAASLKNEEGQGLVEYALVIVLISIAAVVALQLVGTNIDAIFDSIADSFSL